MAYWGGSGFVLLVAVMIIIISFLLGETILYVAFKALARFIKNKEDIQAYERFRHLITLVIIILGFWYALKVIGVSSHILYSSILSFLSILSFIICFLAANIIMRRYEARYKESENADKVNSITHFRTFTFLIILILTILLVLVSWEVSIPEFFTACLKIINNNNYLKSIAIFVIFLTLSKTTLYLFKTYIRSLIRRNQNSYETRVLERIEYPVSLVIIFLGLNISLKQVGFSESILVPIINTAIIIVIMDTVNIILDTLINYWERKWHRSTDAKIDDEIFIIAHNSSKVILVLLSMFFILMVWGFAQELKGVLLSLSVMGVILGFALKNTFANIMGGISLILDHTYKTHDVIKLESGEVGEVVKIGLRSTKIKTYDNEILTVPNGVLALNKIYNYAQPDSNIRIRIPVSVEYGSDPDSVIKILLNSVKRKRFVVTPEKTFARFVEMSDFSLKFELFFYIADYMERFSIQSEMTTDVYNELRKNKIGIPFPTRTVYIKNKKDGRKKTKTKGKAKVR
ncbi:mechanosensitive ion channel [Candidatus Woesearchaeota archaeon]|nr:mechanosensitive ion channel [Candidatus Woesearchaeota archaeon]